MSTPIEIAADDFRAAEAAAEALLAAIAKFKASYPLGLTECISKGLPTAAAQPFEQACDRAEIAANHCLDALERAHRIGNKAASDNNVPLPASGGGNKTDP